MDTPAVRRLSDYGVSLPFAGYLASLSTAQEWLQLLSLVVGFIGGVFTLIVKWREIRRGNKPTHSKHPK